MRFLFVQTELSYRGAERVIASLTKSLVEKNHIVRIIFLKKDLALSEDVIDASVKVTIPETFINRLFQNNLLYTLLAPFYGLWIIAKHANESDQIISDSFPCLWPAILIAKLKNKKIYWMLHSLEKIPPPNTTTIPKAYFWVILYVNKYLVRYVRCAIANSPKVRLNAQNLFPGLEVQEIIPPVAILQVSDSNPLPKLANRKKIICVGHIHPLKNQQLAIDAFIKVREQLPDTSLIIIGDGDPTMLNTYNSSPLDIIFTGKVRYKELQEYYKIADLVLQTSFYPEGLGLTPFEGLFYKKLPVVVDGSGAAMIVKRENIGIVVENNSEKVAHALIEAISHPEKYEYTITKGWKYVTSQLTSQKYVSSFLEIVSTP